VVTIIPTSKIADWLACARQKLLHTSENPSLEAQLLVAHVTGMSRAAILAHSEMVLSTDQQIALDNLLILLQGGEPLPYLLGHWEFYGLDFIINKSVLIPRPETELLVDFALDWLSANSAKRLAADVGTGSGCIGVTLSHFFPNLKIFATDVSRLALSIAYKNATRLSPNGSMLFSQTSLLHSLTGPFDLVCANLPYIPTPTLASLPVAHYEPKLALDGGEDGLFLIRDLIQDAPRWLAPNGLFLLEIDASQGKSVTEFASMCLPGAVIHVEKDLTGKDRLVVINRSIEQR
jgi:release factor glutamine methyltransferase